MKIEIKLEDPKFCLACPCIGSLHDEMFCSLGFWSEDFDLEEIKRINNYTKIEDMSYVQQNPEHGYFNLQTKEFRKECQGEGIPNGDWVFTYIRTLACIDRYGL